MHSGSPGSAGESPMPSQASDPVKCAERYCDPQSWRTSRPRATSGAGSRAGRSRRRRPAAGRRTGPRPSRHAPTPSRPRSSRPSCRRCPPPQIRRIGHDAALMQPLGAAPVRPLRRQQPVGTHQPQNPFPGHPNAVPAAQPSLHLAVAPPQNGESASTCRISSTSEPSSTRGVAAGIGRRPWRLQDAADPRHRSIQFGAHLGRFAGGISSPLFAPRRAACSCPGSAHRPCVRPPAAPAPLLRRQAVRAGRAPLEPALARSQELIPPRGQPMRLNPQLTREPRPAAPRATTATSHRPSCSSTNASHVADRRSPRS